MPSRSIADLDPLLAYAYGKAETEFLLTHPDGPIPFLTATFRSNEEQTALFNQKPKVTNAKAGQSPHNYKPSLALDVAFKDKDGNVDWNTLSNFKEFAALMKKTPGITWGGDFKSLVDRPHFERTNWSKLANKA